MRPVPVVLHLGPLTFHTYGIGLALAFYVAYFYAAHRLNRRGYDTARFGRHVFLLVVMGLVGARAAHVTTNWSYYGHHVSQIIALWQGGLASFGALLVAGPLGIWLFRRHWPTASLLDLSDALLPAIVAAWSVGRFLGPQFMVAGGGHLTHQWFGLAYAGQAGKRVPVPLIQGLEDALLWLTLLQLERRGVRRGVLTATALVVWGLVRSVDEFLLLGPAGSMGSRAVQIAGLVLAGLGVTVALRVRRASPKLSN